MIDGVSKKLNEVRAAVLAERERCALVCEGKHDEHAHGPVWHSHKAQAAQECADIIRKGPQ
jgi:hypothetical protein